MPPRDEAEEERDNRALVESTMPPRDEAAPESPNVAYRRDLTLLAGDADMSRIAEVIGLPLDEASLRTA